MTTQCAKTNL